MKLGFIDYYLDEWHANNYPQWISEASGGEMEVAYAWALADSPKGGLTSAAWCEKYGVTLCSSMEELIEKSDGLIVLSPDNCELHEQLCRLPLSSGKPCYVDKTFAPDKAAAERIFAVAEASGTPCWSTSALRFAEEYAQIDPSQVVAVNSWGPNNFEIYAIHQLEPLMMLMQSRPQRVMALKTDAWYLMTIEFEDGRCASVSGYAHGSPFMMNISSQSGSAVVEVKSDFFHRFILGLVQFFRTQKVPVPHSVTVDIMALREAGQKALLAPGEWVNV
ncbi:MAG: hypothetical protein PUC59_10600 [Firmicutes bacterium]|nr:hypothetical protein [Bacillota bacterium]